ncbi:MULTISPECIES: helix-turn-helix domain-containing protein [Vibrio]|nr:MULTISPECIES: helix-turn-helix domain-containing protein [Vibrio]MCS0189236.1 helix-turn-helix domain-containing protein [Vibrio parahaemolyticus]
MHRRDQDQFLQYIYDAGYSVKEIAREYGLSPQTIYSRINAHRGRGPLQT